MSEQNSEDTLLDQNQDSNAGENQADNADQNQADQNQDQGQENQSQEEKPIEYDFKLPDGVKVDETLLGAFKDLAKEAKLDPKTAQKILDLQTQSTSDAMKTYEKGQAEAVKAKQLEIQNHDVYGKKDNIAVIDSAIKGYMDRIPENLRERADEWMRDQSGNELVFAALMFEVGKDIADDKLVLGKDGQKALSKSDRQARSLYTTAK